MKVHVYDPWPSSGGGRHKNVGSIDLYSAAVLRALIW